MLFLLNSHLSLLIVSTILLSQRSPLVSAAPFNCVGGSVYILAHQDDDLLFQSPDILHSIHTRECVTTITLTAGDAGQGAAYWQNREIGNEVAYAKMAGVSDNWTFSHTKFGGQNVMIRTLQGHLQVQHVWMRLPDGNVDGSGFAADRYASLQKLYQANIASIKAVDGTATYTLATLKSAILQILQARKPVYIRVQDYNRAYNTGDHSDHITSARIVRDIVNAHPGLGAKLIGYMDYPTADLPPNLALGTADFKQKRAVYFAYAAYDPNVCQTWAACTKAGDVVANYYAKWLRRQYYLDGTPAP